MHVLGLDIAKAKFDAHLIIETLERHATFPNTEAGFQQLKDWLERHRAPLSVTLPHACMEATGNWGLDLAAFLYAEGITVSIVNPRQIKAFGESELSRNKTDRLDAALIARFCRSHCPRPWAPPAEHMRALREMVRRCAALKVNRVQEINRAKAGFASPVIKASIARMTQHLDAEIQELTKEIRLLIGKAAALKTNFDLLVGIPGLGEVTAAVVLAELPNIADFTPKALAAFAGLSPQEHSSGTRTRTQGISRIGNRALRGALYMCALSARRHNPLFADFAQRLAKAGKPHKVILVAIARKLLVLAQAILRTQKPFAITTAGQAETSAAQPA